MHHRPSFIAVSHRITGSFINKTKEKENNGIEAA
jgi:hypothetical protein